MAFPEHTYVRFQDDVSIRVLLLQPALDHNAPLVAKLQHVAIVSQHPYATQIQPPEFVAISYAWGNQAPTAALQLQGSPPTSIKIRPNVDEMFRYLRFADRERCLWVDALCINQNDLEEKAAQVKFMGAIYRNAKVVVVWLGPPADAHDSVGQLFEDLVKYAELSNSPERAAAWFALRTLLDRTWFRRRWT
jgi:hypothetical protein